MAKSDSEVAAISIGRYALSDQAAQAGHLDQQILDHFDPSRIPPRVAFCAPHTRTDIIKETDDLLQPHAGTPPSTAQVEFRDPRYLKMHRAFSTLIANRKSTDLYRARIRTRGDRVPLTGVAFISSPTDRMVCVRFLITLATMFRWQLGTLDISQAFSQSSNLNDRDGIVITPLPVITLPWKSDFPPDHIDLKLLHRSRMGFLMVRPLFGDRGLPMRWFIRISTIMRKAGYRQLKTDVCAPTRIHPDGKLGGAIAVRADDILFDGPQLFLREAARNVRTSRPGETETPKPSRPAISWDRNLKLIDVARYRSREINILPNYPRSAPPSIRNTEWSKRKLISAQLCDRRPAL